MKETQRIKSGDAIKLIETGMLANSRIKRKEQSDKQFEYMGKKDEKVTKMAATTMLKYTKVHIGQSPFNDKIE